MLAISVPLTLQYTKLKLPRRRGVIILPFLFHRPFVTVGEGFARPPPGTGAVPTPSARNRLLTTSVAAP